MGAGAVARIGPAMRTHSRAMGRGTNNEAEYHAVIAGVGLAVEMGAKTVTVHGDSQLVLRQLEGKYKVKAENLVDLHAEAKRRLAKFAQVSFIWVPREENAEADRLAREAIGG